MPFNGAGSFTSLGAPTFPAVSGDFILASYFNATMNDVFSGLSNVLPRDGQAAMAANLPMGGFKVTNVGAGAVAGDALMYGQAAAVLAGLTVNTTFAMTGTMTAAAGTVNLTGATSVTVPLQAVADDSDKAASTAYVWDFFATMPSGTLPSMVGKSLYNLRVNAGETGVEWALVTPAIARDARTGNTILGVADQGHLIEVTSGTFSQTFAAAATLGSGWFVYIKNSGTGTITLDPDGAELINGVATFVLPAGTSCLVQCTGTAFTVITAQPSIMRKLPIFSAEAALSTPVSSTETMANSNPTVGLGAGAITGTTFGNSLFLAFGASASTSIATSPDGINWTLRTIGASLIWRCASNGTTGFVGTVASSTTTAKSVDGITWTAGGALPGTAEASYSIPVYNSTIAAVRASAASTIYTTVDNGATWLAQTTPSTLGPFSLFVVGGLFWYYNATTVSYTSATGATGTWTSRTLPVSGPNYVWQDFDGTLYVSVNGTKLYKTTDGINWALDSIGSLAPAPRRSINGVQATFDATLGQSYSYHNGVSMLRVSSSTTTGSNTGGRASKNTGGTIFLIPDNSTDKVIYIEPGAATAKTALFSG